MKDGFIKVAAATPQINVADCGYNAENVSAMIEDSAAKGVKILVFPELCITGYTSGDLFYQETLLNAALEALKHIKKTSSKYKILIFVGLPLRLSGRIYNTAAAVCEGRILGVIPKTFLPNYNEFYEKRQFAGAPAQNILIEINGEKCLFGTKILFKCKNIPELIVGAEICEDLWVMSPPSVDHAEAGASIIVNLSASNEIIGKADYRRLLVGGQSAKLICGYIYSDAGNGESTTDMVFSGHNIIAENGKIINEAKLFENGLTVSEIDINFLTAERTKLANYDKSDSNYDIVEFDLIGEITVLTRKFEQYPFVPKDKGEFAERAELIYSMLSHGLKKRVEAAQAATVVIGISGGLDSSLALLIAVRTMLLLKRPLSGILGITMPCFGTTNRTYNNSCELAETLGITFKTVDIGNSVKQHLKDIEYEDKGITYENAQARERTQVLMDYANKTGGIVIGTGDVSEMALGWSTYNGDHMSMYGVNSSVPKTLVKYLIKYEADRKGGKLKKVLYDILDTPISPELLPADNGLQKTEDFVGPYELVDFFLYYIVRMGFKPSKVYRIATSAFEDKYDGETIKKWLTIFIKRFFSQQFKRSCLPDGVKIGSVSLSPRADWRMPSDAVCNEWLKELNNI